MRKPIAPPATASGGKIASASGPALQARRRYDRHDGDRVAGVDANLASDHAQHHRAPSDMRNVIAYILSLKGREGSTP